MFRYALITSLAALTAACATQEQTAALECGAGAAAVSVLACKLMGGSTEKCAAIGVAGAGIGGLGCYAYSSHMAQREKELEGHENDLDARLRYVEGVNKDTAAYNEQLKQNLAVMTRNTNDLTRQIKQQNVDQDQLAQHRKALDAQLKQANDSLALQRKQLDSMRAFQAQQTTKSKDLDMKIAHEEALMADTRRETAAMAALRERI